MPEYTLEECESRTITREGYIDITLDMIYMAMYLAGGLCFLRISASSTTFEITLASFCIGTIMLMKSIFYYFYKLMRPRDRYSVRIVLEDRNDVIER